MVAFGPINVSIASNGTSLLEYPCSNQANSDVNVLERYIEATAGSPFTIEVNSDDALAASADYVTGASYSISLDGREIGSWVMKDLPHEGSFRAASFSENGGKVKRSFFFAETETVEGTKSGVTREQAAQYGTIEIACYRIWGTSPRSNSDWPQYSSRGPVPSKFLIINSNNLSSAFGPSTKSTTGNGLRTYNIDHPGSPFVTFRFKYRSREALQVLDVITAPEVPKAQKIKEEKSDVEIKLEQLEAARDRRSTLRSADQSRHLKRKHDGSEQNRKRPRTAQNKPSRHQLEAMEERRRTLRSAPQSRYLKRERNDNDEDAGLRHSKRARVDSSKPEDESSAGSPHEQLEATESKPLTIRTRNLE